MGRPLAKRVGRGGGIYTQLGWGAEGEGRRDPRSARVVPVTQLVARCEWTHAFSQLSCSSVYRSTTTKQQLVLLRCSGYPELKKNDGSLNSCTSWDPKRSRALLFATHPKSSTVFCKNGVSHTLSTIHTAVGSLLLCCYCCSLSACCTYSCREVCSLAGCSVSYNFFYFNIFK